MAKQIKAIKCPQCGSTAKTEIKPDHFRCSNCNTEYFLDNDDVTIHHKVEFDRVPAVTPLYLKKGIRVLGIAIVSVWAILFVARFLIPSNNSSAPTFTQSKEADDNAEEFTWFFNDKVAYISAEGKPVQVVLGERTYRGRDYETNAAQKGVYVGFYDLKTGKELKSQKVPNTSKDASGGNYAAATFKNGDVYFIVEKIKIYKVDKANLSLVDVTQYLFTKHPQLTSGIANAEFIYKPQGDGFNLIANDGVNLYYYPLQDRLYTKDQKQAAEQALEVEQAGEPLETSFSFSSKSDDYPAEKVQLIKYIRRDPQGGPNDRADFEWIKDYRTGAKKMFRWGKGVVRNWKDFTPGRQYFAPGMLYSDKDLVLIWFATTPAEKASKSLQCLNAETGEIIFTLPLGTDYYLKEVLRYKDGFVIDNNTSMLLVSSAGKLIKESKIN